MNGRQRVRGTLNFEKTDRIPRDLWALPAVNLYQKSEYEELISKFDMDISRPQLSPGWRNDMEEACSKIGTYKDDWGSVWHVGEPGVIGEVKQPALSDLNKLDSFKLPWHLIKNLEDVSDINRSCQQSKCFMLSDVVARPFERIQFLCGTENVFIELAYGTVRIRKLIEMIHDYYIKNVEAWCKTSVDGILFMDDWGANDTLLISPLIWREVFKPLYKEYCDIIHSYKKFAFFHTDGNTQQIYGDFIEVGIDAINSQLFCMEIEELGRKYKEKITIWGEIDRQHILPFGSPADVEAAVHRIKAAFDCGDTGMIAQCEWGKNNPVENIEQVFKSWK